MLGELLIGQDWQVNVSLNNCFCDVKKLFLPGIEPGTFCVLDKRDDHYTTETYVNQNNGHSKKNSKFKNYTLKHINSW